MGIYLKHGNHYKIWIARTLIAVFGILVLPPEFYHALDDHSDTACHSHAGTFIEKQHHHCAILRFECPSYLADASHPEISASFKGYHEICFFSEEIITISCALPQLRAPPQA